jgi:benzoyl-CoA reductase/2-hydroxyglutaryl-CoA dehydratase subunit BcrC/BadD/HgdB
MDKNGPEFDDKNLNQNISTTIARQIEYLERNNGGIKSLKYFYEVFKELFGNRIKELEHQKENGKKLIGVFCNFIPEELILASNCIPIRLCMGSQEPILRSEEIVPRNFCPLIKSSLGSWMMGSPLFELLDVIIIPTTCDGKKKLAEILVERIPTWILEVPHTNETPQARQHWLFEVQILKAKLEKLADTKITTKKLKTAIELTNRKRSILRKLYVLRKQNPPTIWGKDALLVTNLGIYDDVSRWTAQVETLCNELANRQPVCNSSAPRIMITGSPVVFPTWKIPTLTEESGGIIVIDDICTGSKELWDHIEPANWSMTGMLVGIADKYLMNTCACFTPNINRRDRIIQFIKEFKVDGVIYHTLQGCHIYGMEQHRIEKALTQINIPTLGIETDYSREDVEQIRTRLEAFIEMISDRKLKSGANPSFQASPKII